MKRNLCKNILKVIMTTMLALCVLTIMGGCQSEKELSLNNYQEYISVKYDSTFEPSIGHFMIVDSIIIQKVNKDDKLFDVKIKFSYEINGSEGEFSKNLGDLNSTYRKEIPENYRKVRVLEISGTVQRSINVDEMKPIWGTGALILFIFVILGIFVAHGLRFSANFNKIQTGMSYNKVIEILGEPSSSSSKVDNILTCVWRIHVLRGWIIVRAVTFKDDTVISKTD